MSDHPPGQASDALPSFRFHPDPVSTGAFERLGRRCRVCQRADRGWSYVIGTYGPVDLHDDVCPWCIADGSAADRCGAIFTDVRGAPPDVPAEVLREIRERTPGFSAWQQERWLFHCGDGAAFLGAVGWEELEQHPDALEAVRSDLGSVGVDGEDLDAVVGSLDVDGEATAYLFRCLHCGTHLAYADLA